MVSRVLDASAFYAGVPFSSPEKCYTTSIVFDEIKHIKKHHDAVNALIDTNRLEVKDPEIEYVETVSLKAKDVGDFQNLSQGDLSVIALCLQMHAELISDDFAVSNTAKHLGINVIPVMTKGITRVIEWTYFCPGCEKIFSKASQCPLCGNKLSRKLDKRKSSVNPIRK
ncbi:MAG TPA: nucleotide-binding protein [Nitrosopumilaceae archaeon]|nr:nucleotide-binding protein [Nitrosopumilaceae archaeon]